MSTMNQMTEELDREWANLILSARKLGVSAEEIRAFLRNPDYRAQQSSASVPFEPLLIPVSSAAIG